MCGEQWSGRGYHFKGRQRYNPQIDLLFAFEYIPLAPSTKLILKGKTPAAFLPALISKRAKRKIIREVKGEKYPVINYSDNSALIMYPFSGAFELYINHFTKPLPEKYVHGYITIPGGGICIFTCLVALLELLDDPGAISFENDTTYKRVEGEMNEWELTLFVKQVLRGKLTSLSDNDMGLILLSCVLYLRIFLV